MGWRGRQTDLGEPRRAVVLQGGRPRDAAGNPAPLEPLDDAKHTADYRGIFVAILPRTGIEFLETRVGNSCVKQLAVRTVKVGNRVG